MRFVDYFRKGLMRDPRRAMLIGEERSFTYEEVDELSLGISSALAASGVGDGRKAAVFGPNDPLVFVSLLGIVRAGATWVPLNVRNGLEINAAFLAFIECSCLFYHSSLADEVDQLAKAVPSLELLVCIDAEGRGDDRLSLTDFIKRGTGAEPDVPDDPDRIVTLIPTGGTTGVPKGAQHTQRTWEHATFAFWTTMGTEDPVVHLAAAPLSHGAGALALMMLGGGATTVVLKKADPLSIMRAMEKHRISHMYLPPTVLYMMLAHPDVRKFDYSSLRYFSLAAAPVAPEKLREAVEVFGPAMCQSFGQTEAPQLCTFLSPLDIQSAVAGNASRLSSCGRATLGVRVEVMDADGRILSAGQRGEIVVRGGLVFAGYYKNPKQTEETLVDGWLHTGDIGYRDEEGYFYIVDRKKDMIITGGFNVYSAEVEKVILSHEAVRDCAVIGVPDPKWGEAIKGIVELKERVSAPPEEIGKEIIELVKGRLGGVHAPKSVEFWPELPRSPNGKVLKRDIREVFWADHARGVG